LKLETEDGSFTLTVDGLAEAPTYSFMTSAPRVDTRTFFDLVVTVTTAGQLAVYARASERASEVKRTGGRAGEQGKRSSRGERCERSEGTSTDLPEPLVGKRLRICRTVLVGSRK
jgi:hypothetical protein